MCDIIGDVSIEVQCFAPIWCSGHYELEERPDRMCGSPGMNTADQPATYMVYYNTTMNTVVITSSTIAVLFDMYIG
jgi:hypothetical protein